MNFVNSMLKANDIGLTETVGALASGKSLGDAGCKLSARVKATKFEKMLLNAADSYVAGYTSHNMAFLGAIAQSVGIGAATWGGMKAYAHFSDPDESNDGENNKGKEIIVAVAVAALVFFLITQARRQRMFSVFAGTNMAWQHVKFFSVPFVAFFVIWRSVLPHDVAEIHHVAFLAAGFAGAVYTAIRKFYFVYKLNDIEKDVFTKIASVFEACPGPGADGCDHQHAAFARLFKQMKPSFRRRMRQTFGELDFAEIAKELSARQMYD
ncbi:unnamed protein product, partial [Ectocarpus sp. 4 AP-2014]